MKHYQNYKQEQNVFLDSNIQYRTGLKTSENETLLANAQREAFVRSQMKVHEENRQARKERWKRIKEHEIPFGTTNINFKFAIILILIAFVANIVLSILYKKVFWNNIFNAVAAVSLFYISKHLYPKKEDEISRNITNILLKNVLQVSNDIVIYKLPKFIKEHNGKIIDIVTIVATICFAIFPSTNILYAISVPLSIFSTFLLFALQKQEELESHLLLLNRSVLLGVIIKAIYGIFFASKFVQMDYMNIVLLFLFTYMSFCPTASSELNNCNND